ncbi:MAG: CoA transferase [Chloroflexi bacterium]|nr:CoA transferase [Chloroflexota bacterium]MDA1227132.1 CoA transferase [Chloroflexota bacterium]
MTNALPLDGITVVDFSQILAGPFCTMMLADMGADVIKVEKPNGGDDTRRYGPPFINGESAAFLTLNRNKRSMILDLKQEDGIRIAKQMLSQADVMVHNFRPGVIDRMGLGYKDVHELNPAIVYCTVSGFGTTGPYASKAGFDLIAQGMSGLMSVNGFPDAPPAKIGVPIADLNTGMFAAFGVLTAYVNRLKTGQGQHVDAALLDSGIAYSLYESATYFATNEVSGPLGSAHRMIAPYQAFATKDGYLNLGAANQNNWQRMCTAVGRLDLLEDERFASNAERMVHIEDLTPIMEQTFKSETTAHWVELLEGAGVPTGPIYKVDEVYADPHVQARNMAVEVEHPIAGHIRNIGVPVKLSETPGSVRVAAPVLGADTDDVLIQFGFSESEIAGFKESGAAS